MGIPSYFVHIVKKYRDIIKLYEKNDININNLYLDSNSLIYEAVINTIYNNNHTDFENKLLDNICQKLKEYIEIIKPSNKIFIAFDGIAPVAKLNQQKNRRYKSWFQDEVMHQIHSTSTVKENKWNTAAITPGTNFMDKLDKRINEEFNDPLKYNVEEIIISTSKNIGEGEHKIYEYIRNNKDYHINSSTAIYGLDSDLIMLTLNHLDYCPKMYLFRETPYFIKNLDTSLQPNSNYLLDIPEFADKLVIDMSNKLNLNNEIKNRLIKDYIFLFFFLGNDFMPHFPALNIRTNGIQILLDIYNKINKDQKEFFIEKGKIVWKKVREMIGILGNDERVLLKEEYKIRKKWENRKYQQQSEEQKFINTPLYNRNTELYINPYEDGWENRYYKSLFKIDISDEWKKKIGINYLSILEWNFKYYNEGCINWRYKYDYNYPPLLKDLYNYIPYYESNFLEKKEPEPIHEYLLLAYVLPRNSLNLLPKNITNLLLNKYNEYYKLDYDFEWSFCKYFWECHVLMPEFNINELDKFFKENNIIIEK